MLFKDLNKQMYIIETKEYKYLMETNVVTKRYNYLKEVGFSI